MKTPQEKGFDIPVKRKLAPGRYQKAWARSLVPVNGRIQICFDSGRRSSWSPEVTLEEPEGYDLRPGGNICYECGVDLSQGEHYLTCSKSEV